MANSIGSPHEARWRTGVSLRHNSYTQLAMQLSARSGSVTNADPSAWRPGRQVITGFALLALVPLTLYGWIIVRTSEETRDADRLELCRATAAATALEINRQCADAIDAVKAISLDFRVIQAVRARDGRSLRRLLNSARDLAPSIVAAGGYRRSHAAVGTISADRQPVSNRRWMRSASSAAQAKILGQYASPSDRTAPTIVVAAPLEGNVGFIIIQFRIRSIAGPMDKASSHGVFRMLAADNSGAVVAESSKKALKKRNLRAYSPVVEALKRKSGAAFAEAPDGEGGVLAGHAYAAGPRWAIVAMAESRSGIGVVAAAAGRLAIFWVPLVLLHLFGSWMIATLYFRQADMARHVAEQNKRLLASDQAKTDFLANVSHDLKTPLNNARASITGLMDQSVQWTAEQTNECLTLASDELDQAIARIRNLLEMSAIELQAGVVKMRPADLTDIISTTLQQLEPLMRGRPVDRAIPDMPVLVYCDYSRIQTVITNLVENAVKYSPAGSPIRIGCEMRSGWAIVSVRSKGPGVPPGEEKRIFEKFYRGDSKSPKGGTGLGLAICKSVVEAHRGTIGVRNGVHQSAEFWFTLPAQYG